MVAGTPSVNQALWSLVMLTCIAVPVSSSGRLFGGQEHHEDHGGRSIDHERVGEQRDGISQKLLVDNVTTVDSWLNGATRRAPVGTRPQDRFVSVEHLGVGPFASPCKRYAPSEVPCACA